MEILGSRGLWRHLLLLHLIVAENDSEGLTKKKVEEPKQDVVGVAGDLLLEDSLEDHAWNIDHHESEGDAIEHAEDPNNNVLMEYRTESEGR